MVQHALHRVTVRQVATATGRRWCRRAVRVFALLALVSVEQQNQLLLDELPFFRILIYI